MYVNFFRSVGAERTLPVYVHGIGVGHVQEYISRPEGNMFAELHYTVSGCGIYNINGVKRLLPIGNLIYTPPDMPLEYFSAPGGWTVNWIAVGTPSPHTPFSFLKLGDAIQILKLPKTAVIDRLFYDMYASATDGTVCGRFRASALLYTMLTEINSELVLQSEGSDDGSRIITEAIQYIESNFTEKITLETLRKVCGGISKQYLCRVFTRKFGVAPTEYINRRRVNYARNLLSQTDFTISEIADKCGFESSSYFHRQWNRFEPDTPLHFRETHRGIYV